MYGEWEPDPREINCRGNNHNQISVSIIRCIFVKINAGISSQAPAVQTGIANLIAVFSSIIITVCAVSSIVFLFIGYACGWFSHKHKQSRTSKATSDPAKKNACHSEGFQLPQTPGPLYEELQPKSTPEHEDLVELK